MSVAARLGLATLALLALVAVIGPGLSPWDPMAISLSEGLARPSLRHPLGQDRLGRDLAVRVAYGARVSLAVAAAAVAISASVGALVGLVAGFRGGWVDEVTMRVVDVLLAFPGILLAIAIAAVRGPSLANVVFALSAIGWTGYARLVRAETRSIRARPHVEAAVALGAPPLRVIIRHVLPLLAGALAVQATFGFAGAIVAESSLSFLGLGTAPPTPSWGAMLAEGRAFLLVAPHVTIVPATVIFVTVLGTNFVGDWLRDRLSGD